MTPKHRGLNAKMKTAGTQAGGMRAVTRAAYLITWFAHRLAPLLAPRFAPLLAPRFAPLLAPRFAPLLAPRFASACEAGIICVTGEFDTAPTLTSCAVGCTARNRCAGTIVPTVF